MPELIDLIEVTARFVHVCLCMNVIVALGVCGIICGRACLSICLSHTVFHTLGLFSRIIIIICDARPMVNFPAAEHHHPLAVTKLYCLMMGVNNLSRVVTRHCDSWQSNLRPVNHESNTLTTTLPSHP